MLKRMEIDMNPYTLYPLSNQRSAALNSPVGVEVSIAAYQAVDALVTGATRLAGAIGRWRRRHRAVTELSGLSNHMLKDIGVARGEIRAVVDGLLDAPKARPAGRPHLVAANAPASPIPAAAANDNVAGIAA
jgi:uncharacterized protein YjiS (DUF1127 family)